MNWKRLSVLITGGAGLIGGAMTAKLLEMGAAVTVADNFLSSDEPRLRQLKSSRLRQIYSRHGAIPRVEAIDLYTERNRFREIASHHDVVFHFAAVFGGREFVDSHQTECSRMLAVDHNVISASYEAGVKHLHYASSACVYPPSLNQPGRLLREQDILSTGEGWESSDNLYGFAKLMGELQLKALHQERGFQSSTCRYLTVYGPGEFDLSHAIAALIDRALERDDPYVIWGSGMQERGFTYVDDIVRGSVLASERIADATPVNLGWDKRYAIHDVAQTILKLVNHKPEKVLYDRSKPEGPFSRALDISRAKNLLGWEPEVNLEEGIRRAIGWHRKMKFQPFSPPSQSPMVA